MLLAIFALACFSLAAQSPNIERQAAMNGQIAASVHRTAPPVESVEVQSYVARLGAKIAGQFQSPDSTLTFTFSVVSTAEDNSLHEPLVTGGGYVFVPTRLLLAANDEAEFAGMLAQAMARGPFSFRQSAQNSAAAIPVLVVAGGFTGDTLFPLAAMARQREVELAADKSAVLAMSRAGFDPAALLRYIERLQPPDARLSPFPPRDARIAALREAINGAALREAISHVPPATYAESDEFHNMQQRLRPAPTEPRSPPSLFAK